MEPKPDRRPRLPPKPAEPASLAAASERARLRTLKRDTSAPIQIERDADGKVILDQHGRYRWEWPFDGEDPSEFPAWCYMILDAFGTRNVNVASTFLRHLMDLCSTTWDEAAKCWVEDDGELQLMLGIVRSHRPQNEAQAAQAAQIAATHIITMRVGKRVATHVHDTRMISAYARLVQASAALTDAMNTTSGKRKAVKQQISVRRDSHVHHHHHQHLHAGGGEESGIQAHAKPGVQKLVTAPRPEDRAPLPCSGAIGEVVPLARRKG